MRLRLLAAAVAVVVAGCDPGPGPATRPSDGPSPEPSAAPAERPASASTPRVENHALGRDRKLIRVAVGNLKRLGFWDELTRDTYVVYIATRRGDQYIPPDGHLADAVPTAIVDDRGSGPVCDIRFYSSAMARELVVRRELYELGRVERPPPGERVFWTAVLAHELGHCIGFAGRGERVARRWERRVLRSLR